MSSETVIVLLLVKVQEKSEISFKEGDRKSTGFDVHHLTKMGYFDSDVSG